MKKLFIVSMVSIAFCLGLFSGVAVAADKVFKLELSSFVSPQNRGTKLFDEMCKDVEKRTNGQIKITQHAGNTLTQQNQTYDAVVDGIIDIGFSAIAYNPGKFPQMEALELPYGLKTATDLAKLANDFYAKFQPKEFKDVKILFFSAVAPGPFHTKKPVNKLEDLQGLKIRCPGGPNVQFVKAMGAVPVVLPTGDTYDALSKGVVNGTVSAFEPLEILKWHEVVNYSTPTGASISQIRYLVMNKAKWNSLPANLQQIMTKVAADYNDKLAKVADEIEADATKNLVTKYKHTIIKLDPKEEQRWVAKAAPVADNYIKEKSQKGFPAADQVKWCREWAKQHLK